MPIKPGGRAVRAVKVAEAAIAEGITTIQAALQPILKFTARNSRIWLKKTARGTLGDPL